MYKIIEGLPLAIGAIGASLIVGNYLYNAVSKPDVYFNPNSEFNRNFVGASKILRSRYWPTIWAYNCHLSTIITQIRTNPGLEYHRENIDLPDGGVLGLDWLQSPSHTLQTPTLVFLPGLSGSSQSVYIQHLAQNAFLIGWRSVVVNYRGTNGVELKTPIAYSAGWTNDVRFVCNFLSKQLPGALLVGVGYSLGSNVLVKYLCEEGDKTPLSCAISVSNPYDLIATSKLVETSLYTRVLAYGAVQTYKIHKEKLLEWRKDLNFKQIEVSTSIKHYDEYMTSKMFGFESAEAYYQNASCAQYLDGKPPNIPGLKIPAILISARDDPLIPEEVLPIEQCTNNPHTILILSKRGGHVGFSEGLWPSGITWMDRLILELLEILKDNLLKKK